MLILSAGAATAGNKSGPPYDDTDDPNQGLGNDARWKGIQDDYGSAADASDVCAQPSPVLTANVVGSGQLRPPADPEDDYALDADLGDTYVITLRVTGGNIGAHVTVWAPGCGEVVALGRPDGLGAEIAVFTAQAAGRYTVQVFPFEEPAAASGSGIATASSEPSCYPTCLASYDLSPGGTA